MRLSDVVHKPLTTQIVRQHLLIHSPKLKHNSSCHAQSSRALDCANFKAPRHKFRSSPHTRCCAMSQYFAACCIRKRTLCHTHHTRSSTLCHTHHTSEKEFYVTRITLVQAFRVARHERVTFIRTDKKHVLLQCKFAGTSGCVRLPSQAWESHFHPDERNLDLSPA